MSDWRDNLRRGGRKGTDECCEMARMMLEKALKNHHEYVPRAKIEALLKASCKELKTALYQLLNMKDLEPKFKLMVEHILNAWVKCERNKRKGGDWTGGDGYDWRI